MSGPVARSCVCGANRRLFNTALEFLKLVYQDSGSRAGRTRGVVAPRVALLRLPVAHQMCIPDLRPRPVAPSCGWELKVWITVDHRLGAFRAHRLGAFLRPQVLLVCIHEQAGEPGENRENQKKTKRKQKKTKRENQREPIKSRKPSGSANIMKVDGFPCSKCNFSSNSEFQENKQVTTRREPPEQKNKHETKKEPGENQKEPMKSRKRLASENIMKVDGFP